jgi:hypothetical protein
MVVNATINKVSRVELEQALASKCDKGKFEGAVHALQVRVDEEVAALSGCVSRKASLEDLQYYR